MFISTFIYYFVYFTVSIVTVSYVEAKSVRDFSMSNVWKYFMYLITGIGHLFGFIIDSIFKFICRLFKRHKHCKDVVEITSYILFVMIIILITQWSDDFLYSSVRSIDVNFFKQYFNEDNLFFRSLFSVLNFIIHCIGNVDITFPILLLRAILVLTSYFIIHIILFGFVYGFLENRVHEFNVFSNVLEKLPEPEGLEKLTIQGQFKMLLRSPFEFIDGLCIYKYVFNVFVLLFIALLSAFNALTSHNVTKQDLGTILIGEVGFCSMIGNIIVLGVISILIQLLMFLVIRFGSDKLKEKFYNFDNKCKEKYYAVKQKRYERFVKSNTLNYTYKASGGKINWNDWFNNEEYRDSIKNN